jgi:hypothetical protein
LKATTSTAESTKAVSLKVAVTKVAVTKVAAKKKYFSDGYSSSDSKVRSVTKLSVPPQAISLSDYELRRAQNIARNKARLAMLGLDSKPKEAKTKVVKKRKSLPVVVPRRELPVRNRKVISYKEDEKEDEQPLSTHIPEWHVIHLHALPTMSLQMQLITISPSISS